MRRWSLIWLVVCASCGVRVRLPIAAKVTVRAEAPPVVVKEKIVPLEGAPVVEFFGVPLEGAQDVVFVLDCSGSMANPAQGRIAEIHTTPPPPPPPPPGAQPPPADAPPPDAGSAAAPAPAAPKAPRKIDVAQAELVDALAKLPAGTRMNVLFFNDNLDAFAPTFVALDEANRAHLIEFVKQTEPTGSTALAPAMRTAFMLNAHRIVLLSDGLGNIGGGAEDVLRDAREGIRGGVRIDTIGIGAGQDAALMQALANESGGLYQQL